MAEKLIRLGDGTLVEVEVSAEQAQPISGSLADKVGATFGKVKPVLLSACRPILSVWQELNKDMHIEQAEVQLGLSFEGEGNLYITKSKAGANITVKLVLKQKS